MQQQEHEVEGLTRRIDELRADIQKRRSERSQTIDSMVKRIEEGGDRRRERGEGEPRKADHRPEGEKRPDGGSRPEPAHKP